MTEASLMELAACIMRASVQVMAAVARVNCTVEGMKALNRERESKGFTEAFDEEAFFKVIDKEAIGHNAVVETLTV